MHNDRLKLQTLPNSIRESVELFCVSVKNICQRASVGLEKPWPVVTWASFHFESFDQRSEVARGRQKLPLIKSTVRLFRLLLRAGSISKRLHQYKRYLWFSDGLLWKCQVQNGGSNIPAFATEQPGKSWPRILAKLFSSCRGWIKSESETCAVEDKRELKIWRKKLDIAFSGVSAHWKRSHRIPYRRWKKSPSAYWSHNCAKKFSESGQEFRWLVSTKFSKNQLKQSSWHYGHRKFGAIGF